MQKKKCVFLNRSVQAIFLGLIFMLLMFWVSACEGEFIDESPCAEVPSGGCMVKGENLGQAAEICAKDLSCLDVYQCLANRTWKNVAHCRESVLDASVRDGSVDGGGGVDGSEGGPEVADANPDRIGFDVPTSDPGCMPLQAPDCSVELGVSCTDSACCGCIDFYVCKASDWTLWGECQNGKMVQHAVF